MPASYAVLFKVHFWDAFAQRQLERLKERVGRGDVYIVVDQTGGAVGPIGHPDAYVLRCSEADLKARGLPSFGHFSQFWWSADYALHLFRAREPFYDYYVMYEFDVVMNADLDPMIDRIEADAVDFVSDPILDPPIERFHWLYSAEGVYSLDQMQAWLTCIAVFSGRAVDVLLASKRELGARLASGEITTLPMCEIAIPTALAIAGCSMRPLAQFGTINHYKWTPPYDEGDLPNLTDGTFVHPVLAGSRFVTNMLKWYPAHADFFDTESFLRQRFRSREAIEAALPVLFDEMRRDRRADLCAAAIALMREHGSSEYLDFHGLTDSNIGLNGAATQSSWIGGEVRAQEASAALSGVVTGRASFHTDADLAPWWMVDLLRPQHIEEVRLFNRLEERARADGIIVLVSDDLRAWHEIGRHEGASFGGYDGKPFVVRANRTARFVRVELPRQEYLHLDQVQVIAGP